MPELAKERINFIETLHEVFLMRKGFGALAFVSITDIIRLFDEYKKSNEPRDSFIQRYVNSF